MQSPVFNAVMVRFTQTIIKMRQVFDVIAGPEARGFIFASANIMMDSKHIVWELLGNAPLLLSVNRGSRSRHKLPKLPYDIYQVTYDLEYGEDTLTIHQDAFPKGSRVLLCDDLLATGGTLAASIELVQKLDGDIVGAALLIELPRT